MVYVWIVADVLDFEFMRRLRRETEPIEAGFLVDGRGHSRGLQPVGGSGNASLCDKL